MFFSVNQFHNTSQSGVKTENHKICKEKELIKRNLNIQILMDSGEELGTERIYPLYNITRRDGLRQMRADYKKFDTTWEKRRKKTLCLTELLPSKFLMFNKKGIFFHIFQNKALLCQTPEFP